MTRTLANNVGSSGFLPSRIIAHEKLSQLLTPKGSFEDAHVTHQKKPPKVTFNDYVDTILPFLTIYLPTTSTVKDNPQATSRDQGLKNWTGGTLNTIKLIRMNSRFAKICIKAQGQKLLKN
jgi:hypothetical protein